MSNAKLLDINGLSEAIPMPVRTIRHLTHHRKIPFLRIGHRTIRYDFEKVRAALDKFEVKAVA